MKDIMKIRTILKPELYASTKLTEELAEAIVALTQRNTKLIPTDKHHEKEIGKELADVSFWINKLLDLNPNIKKHYSKKLKLRLNNKI